MVAAARTTRGLARLYLGLCCCSVAAELHVVRSPARTTAGDAPDCERSQTLVESRFLDEDVDGEEEERAFLQTSLRTASHLEAAPAALLQNGAGVASSQKHLASVPSHHFPHPPPLAAPPILMQIEEEIQEEPLPAPAPAEGSSLVGNTVATEPRVGGGFVDPAGFLSRKAALEIEDGQFGVFQTTVGDDRVITSLCWLRCIVAAVLGASTIGTAAYLALEGHKARRIERAAIAALAAFSDSSEMEKASGHVEDPLSRSRTSVFQRLVASMLPFRQLRDQAPKSSKTEAEGKTKGAKDSTTPQHLSELAVSFASKALSNNCAPTLTEAATTFHLPWSKVAACGASDCTIDITVTPSEWPLRATLRRPLKSVSTTATPQQTAASYSSSSGSKGKCNSNSSSSNCNSCSSANASENSSNNNSNNSSGHDKVASDKLGADDTPICPITHKSNEDSGHSSSNNRSNSSNSSNKQDEAVDGTFDSNKQLGRSVSNNWNSISVTADIMDAVGLPPVFFATRVMNKKPEVGQEGDLGGTAINQAGEFFPALLDACSGHQTASDEVSVRLVEVRGGNGSLAAVLTRRPDNHLQVTRPSLPPWDLELSLDSDDYWVSVKRGGHVIAVATRHSGGEDANSRSYRFSRESCFSLDSARGSAATTSGEAIRLQTLSDSTSLESTLLLICIMSTFFLT